MPVTDLLMEGVELMLLGMGSVFVFLTMLVLALKVMSHLAQTLEPKEAVVQSSLQNEISPNLVEEAELTAVISAAIARYRSQRN